MKADFTLAQLDLSGAPSFAALTEGAGLGAVTHGRAGNHLTLPRPDGYPVVRTTTNYRRPQAPFNAAHRELAARAQAAAGPERCPLPYNHALIEVYDQRYRKMGYHCDQALDLAAGSWIAIVSLYDRPPSGPGTRQLMLKHKESGARRTLPMPHGSVVLFSLESNARWLHKIVLPAQAPQDTRWLGLTLRCSKTRLRVEGGVARMEDGAPMTLADAEQRAAFFRLRGQENRRLDFRYPALGYTLSEGDLMPPAPS